eukprot:COSAG06_NODE_15623_length_1057_cov_2.175365_1_plen_69_part_00
MNSKRNLDCVILILYLPTVLLGELLCTLLLDVFFPFSLDWIEDVGRVRILPILWVVSRLSFSFQPFEV